MKQYIYNKIKVTTIGLSTCMLLFGTCLLTACDDYLDVSPSDQQTADQLFANKAGFYTAANGIYDALSGDNLYGKNLTWGAVDIMSKCYNNASLAYSYNSLAQNSYTDAYASPVLSATWGTAYETILAANLLIEQIDKQSGKLTQSEASNLKGEMLAVRAMLHLDMLRLFGPTPFNGLDQPAIPYNNSSDIYTHDLLTIAEADSMILVDLNAAEELLKNDPIIENGPMMSEPTGAESVQQRYRQYRMNYYAVIGLKARAYTWIGDAKNGLDQAKRLIEDGTAQKWFPAIDPNKLLANTSNPDRVFSSEVLMGVYDKDRDKVFDNFFASDAPATQRLQPYASYLTATSGLFAHMMLGLETYDYRFQSQWEAASGVGITGYVFTKYKSIAKPDENDEDSEYYFAKMIPLVTMQEMYYIACECDSTIDGKVDWYNKARIRRGCYDLNMIGLAPMMATYWGYGYGNIFLSNEIRRETWGTGQWFYFAKRQEIYPGYGVGFIYTYDNGSAGSTATYDVQPPLPAGEMK